MKQLAGDIASELANEEGVMFSVSGLSCDVKHKGKVRHLAHTMRWMSMVRWQGARRHGRP
jgi:hypothetical protein